MSDTVTRLNLLLVKCEEELEELKHRKDSNGLASHELGYNNGKLDGEIYQKGLFIRDLRQILKGAENE